MRSRSRLYQSSICAASIEMPGDYCYTLYRYIKKYYRVDYSFAQTLRSLFSIHNETGSVWTHLIGELPSCADFSAAGHLIARKMTALRPDKHSGADCGEAF